MRNQFGHQIRELKAQQKLYLRQVAPLIEMDKAQGSKIQKGVRIIKKEQIQILAEILKVDKDELLILWLADQLDDVAKDEKFANEAMQAAEKKYFLKSVRNNGNEKCIRFT